MKPEVLNWNPKADQYSKQAELEIHHLLHEKKSTETRSADEILSHKRQFRINALENILRQTGSDIQGKVLEVGAGDGWCSAYLAKNKKLEELYCMECNLPALESLIPNTFTALNAPTENLSLVLGSFNDIQKENYFDSVIAMGALHHSANLFVTLSSAYKALKPGGFVLAQEPFMPDETPNSYYYERENKEIEFWGVKTLKNSDRTDLFYRECEYRSAAYHAGFNFTCIKLKEDTSDMGVKHLIKKKLGLTEKEIGPQNMVFLLTKPTTNVDFVPPTAWERTNIGN